MDVYGASYRGSLLERFVNEIDGGCRKARSDAVMSYKYELRREIGSGMPTVGIRFTESIGMIKTTKWEINSLNLIIVEWGVSFVLVEK